MKKIDLLDILYDVSHFSISITEAAEIILKASSESQSVRDNENTKEDLKCVLCGKKTDTMYHCNKGWYCNKCVHTTF